MSQEELLNEVREELLRLLRADDWQITETARRDASPILRAVGSLPTDGLLSST